MKSKDPKQNKEYPKDYTKKQQLKRLREIEKDGCGRDFKFMNAIFTCVGKLDGELEICPNCKKEAQEIKDNWNNDEGCGKIFEDKFWGKRRCGEMEDLKHSDHYILCPSCKEQNKEKDEIFGRILG